MTLSTKTENAESDLSFAVKLKYFVQSARLKANKPNRLDGLVRICCRYYSATNSVASPAQNARDFAKSEIQRPGKCWEYIQNIGEVYRNSESGWVSFDGRFYQRVMKNEMSGEHS